MGYRLGIDLGTTFTAAAYVEDDAPRMLELGNRAVSMPSVLLVAEDGQFMYGEVAERRAAAEPERVIREFKRRFGDAVPIVAAGRSFDPVQLQTELLRWVLGAATDRMAARPDRVVVTHPANWGPYKLQLMRDMVVAAGIPDAVLCPEPVAAAVEYAAKRRVPIGAKLAVYDLGGGTFDVAVLEKTPEGFVILGTPLGVEHLGGADFDEAVFAETVRRLEIEDFDIDDPAIGRGLSALRRECIEAKEALSSDISTEISSLLPGSARTIRFTRAELEGLIRPALEESVSTTLRALRLAGVQGSDVHAIVLVGGSSRIPLVTELLHKAVTTTVAMDTYPKNDIALGAARFAVDLPPLGASTLRPDSSARPDVRPPAESTLPRPLPATGTPPPPMPPRPVPPQDTSPPPIPPPDISPQGTSPQDTSPQGAPGQTLPRPAPPASMPSGPLPPGPAPAWVGGGTPPPDSSLSVEPSPEPRSRRRLLIAGLIGLVVIALGVAAGVVVNHFSRQGSTAGPATGDGFQSSIPPTTSPPSPTISRQATASPTASPTTPDSAAYGFPVGDPLPATGFLVPVAAKTGTPTRLWLADVTRPSKARDLQVPAGDNIHGIGLSPDRRTLTYVVRGAEQVRTMAAEGGKSRLLFDSPAGCGRIRHASWSPTDLNIFVLECSRSDDGPRRLMVVRKNGTIVRTLKTGWTMSADPTISPDGTTVAFWGSQTIAKGDGGSILTMPIDGSAPPTALTTSGAGGDADPAWSPDGAWLAFRRPVKPGAANGNVLIMSATGGPVRTLISGPADEQKPAWSPDGSQLMVVSDRGPNGQPSNTRSLWLVDAEGGKPTELLKPYWRIAAPTWWRR